MEQQQNRHIGAFPSNINKVNPLPEIDAMSITALVRKSGRVCGYQLSDGSRVSREEGVQLAKQNRIRGVVVAENQGTEYLRGRPDGTDDNNLSSLPTVGP